jgi:hypothetical protein
VCDHASWCLIAADGGAAICARTESANRRGNAGWLHRMDVPIGGTGWAVPPQTPRASRADDANLDRVYRAVLGRLQLDDRHRRQLLDRGLIEADLDRNYYRSLPAACRASFLRQLRDAFADHLLLTVPGVVVREGPHGRYLTLAGVPGLLIPIRSAASLIVGLVVRPDEPGDGGKYRWLSSACSGGPSPGWRVHVPAGVQPRRRVVLVEGSLKADVVAALAPGRSVIGLPGCQVTTEAIDTLHALGAVEALLAMDADAWTNPHVADAQVKGLRRLKAAGFAEGLIRWPVELGKGLDDMLLSLRRGQR